MLIVHATPTRKDMQRVVLYCENTVDDYVLNHLLSLVPDHNDCEDVKLMKKYQKGSDSIASSRTCMLKTIAVSAAKRI